MRERERETRGTRGGRQLRTRIRGRLLALTKLPKDGASQGTFSHLAHTPAHSQATFYTNTVLHWLARRTTTHTRRTTTHTPTAYYQANCSTIKPHASVHVEDARGIER